MPNAAYQEEMKHIFRTVKQGQHGESIVFYARTYLWNINELSAMPSLEDQLTGFKRGLLPQIHSETLLREILTTIYPGHEPIKLQDNKNARVFYHPIPSVHTW